MARNAGRCRGGLRRALAREDEDLSFILNPTNPECLGTLCSHCGQSLQWHLEESARERLRTLGAIGGAAPHRKANVPVWHCDACNRSQPGRKDACRYCGEQRPAREGGDAA